jgi:hypothetical protein
VTRAALIWLISGALCSGCLAAQEASSGLDLKATLSGQVAVSNVFTEPPRSGVPGGAGFRAVVYPTWKLSDNWTVTGAWQLSTRQYFFDDFSLQGNGARGNLLQATLNYSRISEKGSLLVRAGELSTSFGSFLLRYDDADNVLVDLPMEYGYYYSPVSILPVAGAQIDASRGKWDGRVQFANSSPANPRSLFEHDQYGNWAGGGGYTIRQGLRVGVSAYRGPYLDRQYDFFRSGEANPNTLPAHALGFDASWAYGHWIVEGEQQQFLLPYTKVPSFKEHAGYVELKRVLNPRWYVAGRGGYSNTRFSGYTESVEGAVGFRPDRFQLIKIDYELEHYGAGAVRNENTLAIQFVTSLHAAVARR